MIATIRDDGSLLHERYGHLNLYHLELLTTLEMVHVLPKVQIEAEVCEAFLTCKKHQDSLEKSGV